MMAKGDLQRKRDGKDRPRYAIESAKWEKLKRSRVIRFERERSARGGLWRVPREAVHDGARVEVMQDDDGRLYLTRTSKDGFVQGWRLIGADGRPLRVAPKHRPAPDR